MFNANDFVLSEDEAEYISNLLDNKYDMNGILTVHVGMIIAPRLIKNNIIPGPEKDILDADFLMHTIHVATAMRIFGLNKYGLFYFYMIEKWGINNYKAVNAIIVATRIAYKDSGERSLSLWSSSIIETGKISNKIFSKNFLFKSKNDIYDEMEYYDEAMKKVFIDDYIKSQNNKALMLGLGNLLGNFTNILNNKIGWKINDPPPFPGADDEIVDLTDEDAVDSEDD